MHQLRIMSGRNFISIHSPTTQLKNWKIIILSDDYEAVPFLSFLLFPGKLNKLPKTGSPKYLEI